MAADVRQRSKSKRPPGDIYRVSDIRAWAKYWDCTQREVRDAAKISGVMIVDIQDWIKINVAR
jgi:hypothetical protein